MTPHETKGPQGRCGCAVRHRELIDYCPTHAAAPTVLAALQALLIPCEAINVEDGFVKIKPAIMQQARAALALVHGREGE